MISIYKNKGITWIDLESPTIDEVKKLMPKYNIPPIVADELLRPTTRSKIEIYNNIIYAILHFPVYDTTRKISSAHEIDFVVGKNYIITAHSMPIAPLHEIARTFEAGLLMGDKKFGKGSGQILSIIIKSLYDFTLRQLDHIYKKTSVIKDNMFIGKEKEMVKEISYVQGDLIEIKRSVYAHRGVLNSLKVAGEKFFGADFIFYLNSMMRDLERLEGLIENSKETIDLLQDTNNSLLSNRTNEIMKVLTVIAFSTFPLVFLPQVFGMNAKNMPIMGMKGDFWIVVVTMIFFSLAIISYFKKKKWL